MPHSLQPPPSTPCAASASLLMRWVGGCGAGLGCVGGGDKATEQQAAGLCIVKLGSLSLCSCYNSCLPERCCAAPAPDCGPPRVQALRPHGIKVMNIAAGNVSRTGMAEQTGKQGEWPGRRQSQKQRAGLKLSYGAGRLSAS